MNEEKDRFGDFISLLERAREDVYFAAKDRELIDRLRRRLEKAQQGQSAAHSLICPRCRMALHSSNLSDLSVNRCAGCGGAWLDHDKLEQFVSAKPTDAHPETHESRMSLRYVWPEPHSEARP